jgi:heme oxygenase
LVKCEETKWLGKMRDLGMLYAAEASLGDALLGTRIRSLGLQSELGNYRAN